MGLVPMLRSIALVVHYYAAILGGIEKTSKLLLGYNADVGRRYGDVL
jgi:hypothetical protein